MTYLRWTLLVVAAFAWPVLAVAVVLLGAAMSAPTTPAAREWKPGDVALTAKGTVALCGESGRFIDTNGAPWSNDRFPSNLRPLVVIDPEDRVQVGRLLALIDAPLEFGRLTPAGLAAALREFATPTPLAVFRHFVIEGSSGLKTAHCGKVWRVNAEANVTIVGDCPECALYVSGGWRA